MRFKLGQKVLDRLRNKNSKWGTNTNINQLLLDVQTLKNQNKILNNKLNELIDIKNIKQATGSLRKIQLLEVFLLKCLKAICKELDINFWLHGGTLLGAVRHEGFIPWDDDVDLGMMRKDLEKLKKYLDTHQTPLKLDYFYFTEWFFSRQARLVFADYDLPLCLDIFVYDNAKDSSDETWEKLLHYREELAKEIKSSGIHCSNKHHIDNPRDKEILDQIFSKYIQNFSDCDTPNALLFGVEHGKSHFKRLFDSNFIRPFKKLKFENEYFYAPCFPEEYLTRQYSDYLSIPKDFGKQKHTYNYTAEDYEIINYLYKKYVENNYCGYTAGAFDLFHIGHLNLLKRAKSQCSKLIVGVTTDELIERTKGHKPAIPLAERMEILKACKYVDEVVVQDDLDKVLAWEKYHYNILFSGDDWKNNPRWVGYEEKLNEKGARVVYLPYTKETSSSKIISALEKTLELV